MMNVFTTKRGRFRSSICWILALLALIFAFTSGLFIAIFSQAIYLLFAALVLAVALLIIARRPEWGLLLSVFLIVVQRSPNMPVVGPHLSPSEVVFALATLAWLAQNVKPRHSIKVYAPGLLGPFLLYTLVAAVSLLFAFPQADILNGIVELFCRIYLMLFLVVVASYTTDASRYQRILLAWVASAVLIVVLTALHLLFQRVGYDPIGLTQDGVLFRGLHNFSTGFAGCVAGTFLGFLPLALSRRPLVDFRRIQTLARWCLPGLLLALVLADSKMAYLAVAAGVLAWSVIRVFKPLGPILVIFIIVVSSIALSSALAFQDPNSVLAHMLPVRDWSARMGLLEAHLQTIYDHPIIGVGLGQLGEYVSYMTGDNQVVDSHYTQVGIVAETGVLGLLAVSLALIAFLRIMRENTALDLDRNLGWLQLNEGLTMAFIGTIIFGLAHDIQTNRTMWLILALIVSLKPASLSAAAHLAAESKANNLLRSR